MLRISKLATSTKNSNRHKMSHKDTPGQANACKLKFDTPLNYSCAK